MRIIIFLSEPIGITRSENRYNSISSNNCTELKQNSQYVLFLCRHRSPRYKVVYATFNMELGRFNTDGTDPDDNIGLYRWKQLLREQLADVYGVTFVPVDFGSPDTSGSAP